MRGCAALCFTPRHQECLWRERLLVHQLLAEIGVGQRQLLGAFLGRVGGLGGFQVEGGLTHRAKLGGHFSGVGGVDA